MAKQFDYRAAFHELAKPAYLGLPEGLTALYALTATAAAELGQLRDCSMPWPEDGGALRFAFEAQTTEDLAWAAHVVYHAGHWYPRDGGLAMPGREAGSHWKFSHYCDQILRGRLNTAGGEAGRDSNASGTSYRVHEGMIRLGYSSPDTWQWAEVAPATRDGLATAHALGEDLIGALPADVPGSRKAREARDTAAYRWFERYPTETDRAAWPEAWRPWVTVGARYSRDESETVKVEIAHDAPAEIARLRERHATKRREADQELAGQIWLLERGHAIDNVIFYPHRNIFCFGWRHELTPAAVSAWLEVLPEFPYEYELKGYEAYAKATGGRP